MHPGKQHGNNPRRETCAGADQRPLETHELVAPNVMQGLPDGDEKK